MRKIFGVRSTLEGTHLDQSPETSTEERKRRVPELPNQEKGLLWRSSAPSSRPGPQIRVESQAVQKPTVPSKSGTRRILSHTIWSFIPQKERIDFRVRIMAKHAIKCSLHTKDQCNNPEVANTNHAQNGGNGATWNGFNGKRNPHAIVPGRRTLCFEGQMRVNMFNLKW